MFKMMNRGKSKAYTKNNYMVYLKSVIIGLITGMANGLFGAGGGTIAVPAMILLLKAEDRKAHATAIAIILPLTIISSVFYVKNGFIDINITWKAIVGGVVGGFVGAKLLNICPANLLRKIFGVVMIIAAIRLIK